MVDITIPNGTHLDPIQGKVEEQKQQHKPGENTGFRILLLKCPYPVRQGVGLFVLSYEVGVSFPASEGCEDGPEDVIHLRFISFLEGSTVGRVSSYPLRGMYPSGV